MFLQLPFLASSNLQHIVLVLNTVILIVALVVAEVVYSETPRAKRKHLVYFLPMFVVLVGILIYAAYKQTGN
jgi:hypothetical protein